ncbi:MAG: hypothetical protein ACI8RZ_007198, partial [Myxococcota bacterium]
FYGLNESDQGVDEHRASPDAFSSYPDLKTQGEEGSHLTGFVGLTPSPHLSTNRQSARLRPALVELHDQ